METKLIKALTDLLAYMHCYGDAASTSAVYTSPVQQLRAQADEMEARDKAIKSARAVLKEATEKPVKG
jgi:hypothetical protein